MERKKGFRKVVLVKPRGFCAGVVRAIETVERALEIFPPPIYVRKEIVHNEFVVGSLRERGVHFVDEVDEVADGATLIFSAHGVSPQVRRKAVHKRLQIIDATCPLVTKVHLECLQFAKQGYSIVLIGHAGHEEVEGTMGEAPQATYLVTSVEDAVTLELANPDKVVYLTQTTLSVDDTKEIVEALLRKFPNLISPPKDDICYATQNRQWAVRELARHVQLILVIGAKNSSNSQRLKEVAQATGVSAHLISGAQDIDTAWLDGVEAVGLTSGASAPEVLVQHVVARLQELGAQEFEELELLEENVRFSLPNELVERMQ